MTEITVTRSKVRPRPGAPYPPYWLYEAQGPDTITMPDGRVLPRRFDNTSIGELRRVLRKAYGRDVKIIEPWKTERRGCSCGHPDPYHC